MTKTGLLGMRLQRLRLAHGHSLRDAEKHTGINRSTLSRLENGAQPAGMHALLDRIARAYGIAREQLDYDPAGDFIWFIRALDPGLRLQFFLAPVSRRVYAALHFVLGYYDGDPLLDRLAASLGLERAGLFALYADWYHQPPDAQTIGTIANSLVKVCSLPSIWFEFGYLKMEAINTALWSRVPAPQHPVQ